MGNSVGTEVHPPDIEDILKKSQPQVEERTTFDCYNSILRAWVFSHDEEDNLYVINHPVSLQKFNGFDEDSCYIVLHMYRNNRIEPLDNDMATDIKDSGKMDALDLAKTTNNLSPRGQTNCFGGFHSASGTFNNSSKSSEGKYDIYIWNGKNASQLIKANSLAKVFELDGALKEGKCLDSLSHPTSKLVSISSIFYMDEKTAQSDDWTTLLKSNHLLNTINNSYQFTGVPGRLLGTTECGSVSLSQIPSSKSKGKRRSTRTKRKDADKPNTRKPKDLPMLNIGESKSQNGAPSEKQTPFRSVSLPASRINQLCNDFRIDMSMVESDPEEDIQQESKARKIARFDRICSKITDSLYIGSDTIARDKKTLQRCGITHILNCAGTICENYFPGDFVYKTLFLYDGQKENIECLFYDVLDFMDSAISKGGVIYVHCHQGISRSSAMLILYLMWKEKQQFITAHEFVKAKRDICNPNAGFVCQLLCWWSSRTLVDKDYRIFLVTQHRKDCPEAPALREITAPKSLDPRGCYIMYNEELVFSWKGNRAHMFLRKCARRFVKLLQRFDDAPGSVVKEKQGHESEKFAKCFPDLVGSIEQNPEYDQYFELLQLLDKPLSKLEKKKKRLSVSLSEHSNL